MGSAVVVPLMLEKVISLILKSEVLQLPVALLKDMHCVMLVGSWTLLSWKFLSRTFFTSNFC